MILISYVVPMYNAARHVRRCVEALSSQGLAPEQYEVILVDDGSSDGTAAAAEALKLSHPSIRLILQPNQGVSVARNNGLGAASGRYVWFVDVDDCVFPSAAPKLLDLASHLDLDVITFRVRHLTPPVPRLPDFDTRREIEATMSGHDYVAAHNYNNGTWLCIARRDHILSCNLRFQPGRFCEDGMFTMELLSSAKRVAHYPAEAYVYVRWPNSVTTSNSPAHFRKLADDFLHAAEHIENYLIAERRKSAVPEGYVTRLRSRRDSFVLFLFLRLLRSKMSLREIMRYRKRVRAEKWLPLRALSREEYPGLRYTLSLLLINNPVLFYPLAALIRLKQSICTSR